MSTGKYISLEEARNSDQLERFAKEHHSEADKEEFESLLDAMCKGEKPKKPEEGDET